MRLVERLRDAMFAFLTVPLVPWNAPIPRDLPSRVRYFAGLHLEEVAKNRRLTIEHERVMETLKAEHAEALEAAREVNARLAEDNGAREARIVELERAVAKHGKDVARLARRIARRTAH